MSHGTNMKKKLLVHWWTNNVIMKRWINFLSPAGFWKGGLQLKCLSVCRSCSLTGSSPQAWLESTTGMWKEGAKKTSWNLQTSLNIDSATFTPPLPSPPSSTNTQTSEETQTSLTCCNKFALISAITFCVLNIGAQISMSVSVDLLLFKVFFQVKPSRKKNKGNGAIFVLFLLICRCCWHLWQVVFWGFISPPLHFLLVLSFVVSGSNFVHTWPTLILGSLFWRVSLITFEI